MTMPRSVLAIFLLLASCLIPPTRCLAYPALTEALTDMSAYLSGQTVYFDVNDPSRGWVLDSRTVTNPTNPVLKDGVVAWTSQDASGHDILWLTVYDPGVGRWQTTSQGFLSVVSPVVADGVVSCVVQGYGIPDIITSVFFATYDPTLGAWRTGSQPLPAGGPDHLANNQGIVVFGYGSGGNFGYGEADFFIYDLNRSGWIKGSFSQAGASVVGVSVVDFQAKAQVGGSFHAWGYDPGPGNWVEDAATKPLAAFAAQPASGRRPLLVWFTDMSIGANAWSYHFLDTNTYVNGRSCFRTYTRAGLFGVERNVSGPGGSASATKTIRVNGSPVPLLLLLD
jgi:hypothetical protein